MALANFSLPFGALAQPWGVTLAPLHPLHQLASNTNNLLYSPADHQQPQSAADAVPPAAGSDYYKNNPYGPPEGQGAQTQQQPGYPYSGRRKQGSAYLPPTGGGSGATRNSVYHIQQQQAQQHAQHTQQAQLETNENSVSFHSSSASSSGQSQSTLQLTQSAGRGPAEGSYTRYPGQAPQPPSLSSSSTNKQQKQYYNAHGSTSSSFTKNTGSFSITSYGSRQPQGQQQQPQGSQQQQPHPQQPQLPNLQPQQPPPLPQPQSTQSQRGRQQGGGKTETPASTYGVAPPDNYPERAPGFTRVQAGQGSRTQVHAVLDYDVEEGDEEEEDDDGEYYDAQGQNKGE